jgi:lysophospholipase L1-like esterase
MRTLGTAFLFLAAAASLAAQSFHLHNGDRVVFYGDSITDQRLYTTFAETYVVTRFPALDVKFIHSGWGGDRVSGGGGGPIGTRLERDVFAYKPTVMTIMLGMNDGRYRPFDEGVFAAFSSGYESMLAALKKRLPALRLTLIRPSPYDDVTREPGMPAGYNAVLVRYGDYLARLAARERALVADLNAPVVASLERANAADKFNAQRMIPDRVHPGPAGQLLMAAALLKAWGAPAEVSTVEIDGAGSKLAASANTSVTEFQSASGRLRWTQTDKALPFPLDLGDVVTGLALRSSDFMDSLNRQMLRVSGLTGPRYLLRIDGDKVGVFSGAQLASGINLAILDTPMMKQARGVHSLTLQHNNIHFARWRAVQVPLADFKFERVPASMAALDQLEEEMVARQRTAARPQARRYELFPE